MEEATYAVCMGFMRRRLAEFSDPYEAFNFASEMFKVFKKYGRERSIEIFYENELYFRVKDDLPLL